MAEAPVQPARALLLTGPRAAAIAITAAAALGLNACSAGDWLEFRGRQGRGVAPTTVAPPLALKWKLPLQVGRQATSFNPPIVYEGTIYFGADDGNFYALDAESGYMRWIFKARAPNNSVPYADEDAVYFGSNDGSVYAVSRDGGEELWSFQTESTVQSLILRYDDLIIFTSDNGASYFLDPDGIEVHRIPNPIWSYHTFQVYEGVIYWAPAPPERGVSFGAYDIESRSYLWYVDGDDPYVNWYSFPALRGQNMYYATGGAAVLNFLALDRTTGRELWRKREEPYFSEDSPYNPVRLFFDNIKLLDYMAPALWRNLVIYTSGDQVVRAFDAGSGREAWRVTLEQPTSSAPTVAGSRLYFGVRGDPLRGDPPRLICLSARNGRLLWDMELDGAVLSAPVASRDLLIFGTDQNYFYVLQEVL